MQATVFTEPLQCLLTQDEKLILGEELAQLLLTTHKLELEKKTFCDDIKAKLNEAEERAQDVGRQLREGKEWREIECKEVPDYEHGQVDTVRTDINEVIRSRRMRPEERQETIVYPDGTSCSPPKTPRSRRLEQTNKDDDEDDADDDLFKSGLQ